MQKITVNSVKVNPNLSVYNNPKTTNETNIAIGIMRDLLFTKPYTPNLKIICSIIGAIKIKIINAIALLSAKLKILKSNTALLFLKKLITEPKREIFGK